MNGQLLAASIAAGLFLGEWSARISDCDASEPALYRRPRSQFITAADATFMGDEDRVIGVMSGKIAKAYPAAILSQHGLVEDSLPKGPIAITW